MSHLRSTGPSGPSVPDLIDAFVENWQRSEREDPEAWLRRRQPPSRPETETVATLRALGLLLRHRSIGLASASGAALGPSDSDPTASYRPAMSAPTGPAAVRLREMQADSAWLRSQQLYWIGPLHVSGGGMGVLALAWHSGIDQEVVLKVANAPHLEARFRREIQVHTRLGGHENVALARTSLNYRGRQVLMLDYLPGLDLRRRVRAFGPLPYQEACRCARQAALGLGHAHRQGVIHRDVKSSNLIHCRLDNSVRVLDWGLALDSGGLADRDERLTQPGGFLGTRQYCAPEQAADPAAVSPATDLYGLGCSWYEWLTGDPPFRGEPQELLEAHARKPVPPIPEALGVPRAVEAVVLRLLKKEPRQRYATAEELLDALDRAMPRAGRRPTRGALALANQVLHIPRLPTHRAGRRPTRGALVLAGAAVGVGVLLILWGARPTAVPDVLAMEIQLSHPRGMAGRTGTLGETVFEGREGEELTVSTKLSNRAFAYLIAFRPDGQVQLCTPTDDAAPPRSAATVDYPPDDPTLVYRLDNGPGLLVFAVVSSRSSLPAFRHWLARAGQPPWKHVGLDEFEPGLIYVFHDHRLHQYRRGETTEVRGTSAQARGARLIVAGLGKWLESAPGVETVSLRGFAVVPDKSP